MLKTVLTLFVAAAQALAIAAEPAVKAGNRDAANASSAVITASWTCQAFYLPARSMWQRTVELDYDGAVVRAMRIDGVAVYTFTANGASLMTAIDGERIQFDVAALTWSSDLRGLVSSTGRCAP